MSVKSEVENFGNFILSLNQNIKVLVNNAGAFIPGQILEEEEGVLETLINTNVYSAYYLSRILVPQMKKS